MGQRRVQCAVDEFEITNEVDEGIRLTNNDDPDPSEIATVATNAQIDVINDLEPRSVASIQKNVLNVCANQYKIYNAFHYMHCIHLFTCFHVPK
jgi:hypothetical protein